VKITRREITLGGIGLGVAALALGGATLWKRWPHEIGAKSPETPAAEPPRETTSAQPPREPVPAAPSPDVAVAELMKPNPLGEMAMGDEKAPITVVEYASMTCPHCAHFSETTLPELKKRYIDTGKVRFILREFPLDQLAAAGFILARCAGPDKYFPLVETLFASQRNWVVQKPLQPMVAIAKQAGLSQEAFEACLDNREIIEGIEKVRNEGAEKFGVNSTPTFFVNGKRLSGALSIEEMEKEFAPYLKS
jgi:protein-disulfide isomerase